MANPKQAKKPDNSITVKIDFDALGKIKAEEFVLKPGVGAEILKLKAAQRQLAGIEKALSAEFMRLFDSEGIQGIVSDDIRITVSKPAESMVLVDEQKAAKAGLLKVVADSAKIKDYQKANKGEVGVTVIPPGFEIKTGGRRVTYTAKGAEQ